MHEAEFGRMPHGQVEFRFENFALPVPGAPVFCADLVAAVSAPMAALRQWGADLMLLGCTTASMSCEDTPWRAALENEAGVLLVTAAGASREAFAALGLHRLTVITPYGPVNNGIVRAFLDASGIEPVRLDGLGLDGSAERWAEAVPTLTMERVLDHALALDSADADGLYLPCTGMVSVAVVDAYEKRTGKPATSSVQASYRTMMAALGLPPSCADRGRLLGAPPGRL